MNGVSLYFVNKLFLVGGYWDINAKPHNLEGSGERLQDYRGPLVLICKECKKEYRLGTDTVIKNQQSLA